jgi:hypothetical protein
MDFDSGRRLGVTLIKTNPRHQSAVRTTTPLACFFPLNGALPTDSLPASVTSSSRLTASPPNERKHWTAATKAIMPRKTIAEPVYGSSKTGARTPEKTRPVA